MAHFQKILVVVRLYFGTYFCTILDSTILSNARAQLHHLPPPPSSTSLSYSGVNVLTSYYFSFFFFSHLQPVFFLLVIFIIFLFRFLQRQIHQWSPINPSVTHQHSNINIINKTEHNQPSRLHQCVQQIHWIVNTEKCYRCQDAQSHRAGQPSDHWETIVGHNERL